MQCRLHRLAQDKPLVCDGIKRGRSQRSRSQSGSIDWGDGERFPNRIRRSGKISREEAAPRRKAKLIGSAQGRDGKKGM